MNTTIEHTIIPHHKEIDGRLVVIMGGLHIYKVYVKEYRIKL
jgi:hypothetical protein